MAGERFTVNAANAAAIGRLVINTPTHYPIIYDPKTGLNLYQKSGYFEVPAGKTDLTGLNALQAQGCLAWMRTGKAITAFSFLDAKNEGMDQDVAGVIDEDAHTIEVLVPYAIDTDALISTFTLSDGASAKVGSTAQVSGTTANDFSSDVTYTVTAHDLRTQDYTVTITNDANPLSDFGFLDTGNDALSADVVGVIDDDNKIVYCVVPAATVKTALIATFTAGTDAVVTIGETEQTSGTTVNDYSDRVTYTILADSGLSYDYEVQVYALEDSQFTSFKFTAAANAGNVLVDATGTVDNDAGTIAVTLPVGTIATALVATFEIQSGTTATVGEVAQVSGTTANDFTNPVTYNLLTDLGVSKDFVVTVTVLTE